MLGGSKGKIDPKYRTTVNWTCSYDGRHRLVIPTGRIRSSFMRPPGRLFSERAERPRPGARARWVELNRTGGGRATTGGRGWVVVGREDRDRGPGPGPGDGSGIGGG